MPFRTAFLSLIFVCLPIGAASPRASGALTILHHFDPNLGRPEHPLISIGIELFGLTYSSVFKIGLDGSQFVPIRVSPGVQDQNPAILAVADSELFGIRFNTKLVPLRPGGPYGYEYDNLQMVSLKTDGSDFRILNSFQPPGSIPPRLVAPLLLDQSAVYAAILEGLGPAPDIVRINRDGTGYLPLQRLPDFGHFRASAPILLDSTLFGVTRSRKYLWRRRHRAFVEDE